MPVDFVASAREEPLVTPGEARELLARIELNLGDGSIQDPGYLLLLTIAHRLARTVAATTEGAT